MEEKRCLFWRPRTHEFPPSLLSSPLPFLFLSFLFCPTFIIRAQSLAWVDQMVLGCPGPEACACDRMQRSLRKSGCWGEGKYHVLGEGPGSLPGPARAQGTVQGRGSLPPGSGGTHTAGHWVGSWSWERHLIRCRARPRSPALRRLPG